MRVDVAIVGAGPAGSACAISLRAHASEMSVALIEASHFDEPRAGETLSPIARPMLEHLGVLSFFLQDGHAQTHGTAAAWGGKALHENEYLFHARGPGWHLDRARFDALLANHAASRGAALLTGTRVLSAAPWGSSGPRSLGSSVPPPTPEEPRTRGPEGPFDGWHLSLSSGARIEARFLVDATGNAAIATRFCGARVQPVDHLIAFGCLFADVPGTDPRTIVEAFEDGWWYTAALPDGSRFVACMTDGHVARRLQLTDAPSWRRLLDSMPQIGNIVRGLEPRGPVTARACGSQRLDPIAGPDWLATGDAASRVDPLSSAGIPKALRSGIFASYAIADGPAGLHRYARITAAEFDAFLRTRARVYGEEGRWRGREFWAGRG